MSTIVKLKFPFEHNDREINEVEVRDLSMKDVFINQRRKGDDVKKELDSMVHQTGETAQVFGEMKPVDYYRIAKVIQSQNTVPEIEEARDAMMVLSHFTGWDLAEITALSIDEVEAWMARLPTLVETITPQVTE
jgi:hypothetical protein